MDACKTHKEAAEKCLESVQLDPEKFRVGHTKARKSFLFRRLKIRIQIEISRLISSSLLDTKFSQTERNFIESRI